MVNIFSTLAAAAGGETTIFSAQTNMTTTRLNNQMSRNFEQRVNDEVSRIESSFASELNSTVIDEDKYTRYRTDIGEALDTIKNTSTRLDGVLNRLDSMIRNINQAQQTSEDPDEFFRPAGYAAAHDSYFRQLDDLIQNTRVNDNLLSSNTSSTRYPINLNGTTSQVYGNDLTTKYYIEEADGTKWYPDQSSQIFRDYSDYPFTEGDESVSMIYGQGLTVDSISGTDVDFTIGANGASPQSYSGTLHREGLEVLNSWLYDGMETQDGRDRALEDLYAAKEAVKVELARYDLVTTTLNYYDEIAADQIHGIREERITIQSEAAEAISLKQQEMMLQYQSVQSALAQSLVVQNEYKSLFPGISNDPLTMRLMNVQV
ncbi:MAG: hypothetical protein HWE30_01600 [Methylocystaceae bacterium]|nr:hypothetical protein [Methylocystaceae bacterium]